MKESGGRAPCTSRALPWASQRTAFRSFVVDIAHLGESARVAGHCMLAVTRDAP